MAKGILSSIKQSLITHIIIGYVFMASGLIVCLAMAVAYALFWWWNKALYRKVVTNLAYSNWSGWYPRF